MPLTELECKSAKGKEKAYRLADGGGLYLEIMPSGARYWRLKYRIHGKENRYAIGTYPQIPLKEARIERDKAKKLIAQGVHPAQAKKTSQEAAKAQAENTFHAVAHEWFMLKKEAWSDSYGRKVRLGLEKNIYPYLGKRPIADIKPPELLAVLRKIESRGAYDITKRTNQICGQIFKYGIQTGKCEWNPAQNLSGATKPHKTEHFRTLEAKDIHAFLTALERNEPRLFPFTRRAMWLQILTFVRPKELRFMRWADLDLNECLWSIPAHFMKMKNPHIVPLVPKAIQLIKEQQTENEWLVTPWVFPSQRDPRKPMSDGTLNKAIRLLGFGDKLVAHGFRPLARTLIREKLGYDGEIIEKQLAHKSSGPLGEAYDRTQFLDQRIPMMNAWANYLEEQLHGKK